MAKRTSSTPDAPDATATNIPFTVEEVVLDTLRPHPRNYQTHPDDELEHIMASIRESGVYRNIVISSDDYICAGHGVTEACRRLGRETVPVRRLSVPHLHPLALKVLVGDNEIRHLADRDDRAMTDLLRELADLDQLLGTGYDEMMLANLTFVTRPATEIEDLDAAAHWAGMPDYDGDAHRIKLTVNFANEEDRTEFCHILGLDADAITDSGRGNTVWWPKRVNDDLRSVRFVSGKGPQDLADGDDADYASDEESLEEYDEEDVEDADDN